MTLANALLAEGVACEAILASDLGSATCELDPRPRRVRHAPPTKLTDELQERICLALRAGNFLKTAATLNGVSEATLIRWRSDPRPRYRAFAEATRVAEAANEAMQVATVNKGASKDPAVALKMLQLRYRRTSGERASPSTVAEWLAEGEREAADDSYWYIRVSREWIDALVATTLEAGRRERKVRFERLDGLRSTDEENSVDGRDDGGGADLEGVG